MPTLVDHLAAFVPSEDERVFSWRSEQFHRLGFSAEMSCLLAGSDADLGRARLLASAGCPLELALQILL